MNETLDAFAQLTDLDEMSALEQRLTNIVRSQDIATLATKRKPLNIERERALIDKAKTTRCKCRKFQPVGNTCMRYTCRHDFENHNKVGVALV